MIEKICEIINDEYCCDIHITIEEWKQLLTNPTVFDNKSKEAIRKWYMEPRYSTTCGCIGKKYNEHSMSANGIINGLAGRVQNKYLYLRSHKISINALQHANYKCEFNNIKGWDNYAIWII